MSAADEVLTGDSMWLEFSPPPLRGPPPPMGEERRAPISSPACRGGGPRCGGGASALTPDDAPTADPSLAGKLRRKLSRLQHRRPLANAPDRPIVSFSFDDIPESAALNGAAALEARGVRGSFYVCAGLFGQVGPMGRYADAEQVRGLAEAGHEIGCHTFSHLDCGPASPGRMIEDARTNAEMLRQLIGSAPVTFAFPFGDVSGPAKASLRDRFRLLRALHPGLMRQGSDLNQAPSPAIDGPDGEARALGWIERAASGRAWVILCLHDVADRPSPWGVTPDALSRMIDGALGLGCEVLSVAAALDRVEARP